MGSDTSRTWSSTEGAGSRQAERPHLVLVTPYHPLDRHFHAAGEIALPALGALAEHYRVTVVAPEQQRRQRDGTALPADAKVVTVGPARPGLARLIGRYPAGARKDWTRAMTREALELIDGMNADRLHVEYLQPAEVGLNSGHDFTITLHDVGSRVYRQRISTARNRADRVHRWLEWQRVSNLEQRLARHARAVVALSERDASELGVGGAVAVPVKLGIQSPTVRWSSATARAETAVFAGALWRDANSAIADWLVREVWPEVLRARPSALLRIVGHGAPHWLDELCSQAPGVLLVGSVPDIAESYQRAAVALAPSLLDAGVLLKALSAMAQGVPVVLNHASARPIGVTDGCEAFVAEETADFASAVISAFADPRLCADIGEAGRRYVEKEFSWSAYGRSMRDVIG